jgi:hypothetical protein
VITRLFQNNIGDPSAVYCGGFKWHISVVKCTAVVAANNTTPSIPQYLFVSSVLSDI